MKEAENITRYQFQQYGLFYATDEQISNYAKETLKEKKMQKELLIRYLKKKLSDILKELVKLENKKCHS